MSNYNETKGFDAVSETFQIIWVKFEETAFKTRV